MAKIVIIYGSGGGNTEVVCRKVSEVLEEKGHEISLIGAKNLEPEMIPENDLMILASPTYGHGLLEKYFGVFMEKLKKVDLKGKKCVAIGLGDPKYDEDYHLESVRTIVHFLRDKEADIIFRPLMISKSPLPYLSDFIPKWANELSEKLQK